MVNLRKVPIVPLFFAIQALNYYYHFCFLVLLLHYWRFSHISVLFRDVNYPRGNHVVTASQTKTKTNCCGREAENSSKMEQKVIFSKWLYRRLPYFLRRRLNPQHSPFVIVAFLAFIVLLMQTLSLLSQDQSSTVGYFASFLSKKTILFGLFT